MRIPTAVSRAIEDAGLLLQADAELPSVATLIAGEAIRGSWWAHPRAHDIFAVCLALDDREDLITIKLLKGKVTHVARPLWPALFTLSRLRAPWQRRTLKPDAERLLQRVEREGELRLDRISWRGKRKPGVVARELEARLLLLTEEVHTEQGRHAKSLLDWEHFGRRHDLAPLASVAAAEHVIEEAALRLDVNAKATLPWR